MEMEWVPTMYFDWNFNYFYSQLNEFIIGNVEGTLAIFKGNGSKTPWRKCKGLGTVSDIFYPVSKVPAKMHMKLILDPNYWNLNDFALKDVFSAGTSGISL